MANLAAELPSLRAVVIVSPHWETQAPTVGCGSALETLHDFHGFDPRLYSLRYPAVGSPAAAREVVNALADAGLEADIDNKRGLDHGAWVPLMHIFPEADIPVVPLSIQHHQGPKHAYRVGQALEGLRHRGFLIIGSGNLTHNLSDWRDAMMNGKKTPAYVQHFSDWVASRLAAGDIASLLNYRDHENGGRLAHPRDEHLLPFFTALGAAGPSPQAQAFHRGIDDVVLAMDGYRFHSLQAN